MLTPLPGRIEPLIIPAASYEIYLELEQMGSTRRLLGMLYYHMPLPEDIAPHLLDYIPPDVKPPAPKD